MAVPTRGMIGRIFIDMLVLSALTGCSTVEKLNPLNWWSSQAAGPAPTPLAEIKPTLTMIPAWRASVGSAGNYSFAPAVFEGSVFAAGADGTLAAFDARSGAQKWRVATTRAGLSAGVGAGPQTIVVATVKGEILAFDGTGREKWKVQVSSEVLAQPLVIDGAVLIRSNDNRIHAFAAGDGRQLWVYQRIAPALVLRNFGGLSAAGGTIFAGFPGGKLVALALSNGSVRWEGTVALPRGATEIERIADVTGAPALTNRLACAVAYQGRAACFDSASGQLAWTRDVASQAGMTADTRYAFVSDERSAVVSLAVETGTSLWKQERMLYRGLSAPLSIGRVVVVGDFQGVLHALAREDGSLVGRVATEAGMITAAPVALSLGEREGFLVQTRTGALVADQL